MHAHVVGVLLAALAIVIVGETVAAVIIVARDDASTIALARTLGSELENHAGDSPSEIDVLIRHEREEQRWFARRTEVFRDGVRLGSEGVPSSLVTFVDLADGCTSATVHGVGSRVCVVHEPRQTVIVVASPLAPLFTALVPLALAIAVATFLTATAFALLGARVVRRRLAPLTAFERTVDALPPLGSERQVSTQWGAAEVDALAATFNGLLARIDDAVARERHFVANAAHELRTPLTRLRAQLDLAIEEMTEGATPKHRVVAASRSCQELAKTTEALLALARDEVVRDDVVNLADIVREQIEALGSSDAHRVEVEGDDEVLVRGDETLLSLAIRNLVDNAMKYADGGATISVRCTASVASVIVEDRGPGIPEIDLERVCEPFVRGGHIAKKVRGTGLGLALTRHIAMLHGGTLQLRNRSVRGLAAELRLDQWCPSARLRLEGQDERERK